MNILRKDGKNIHSASHNNSLVKTLICLLVRCTNTITDEQNYN